MPGDDLNEPLGLDRDQKIGRDIPWNVVGLCGLAVLGAGLFVFARLYDDGMGGEPFAVARIETAPKAPPKSSPAAAPANPAIISVVPTDDETGTIKVTSMRSRNNAADVEASSGVKVVRPGGALPPGGLIIEVPRKSSVELAPAPDRRLVEKGKYGPLPKIGADGSRPLDVYSRPMVMPLGVPARAPRVAIVVGGMGLSVNATRDAIDKLPSEVTFAFAPYGSDLPGQVAKARGDGHEVILQLPMDGPAGVESSGPHALDPDLPREQLTDRLAWLMSRFTGYVGVENFLGNRFTAREETLGVVLKDVAARGLLYLDDGVSAAGLAATLGPGLGAPVARADVVIDADRSPAAIDAALARLEKLARDNGGAIGAMSALPAVVDQTGVFLAGLEKRGVVLAPLSAVAAKGTAPVARLNR